MKKIEDILGDMEALNAQSLLNGAKYYKLISQVMKAIHAKIATQEFDIEKVATETDIREEYFEGVNYQRAVVYLMSNGCEWALKSGNGCSICGHLAKQTRKDETISSKHYLNQFISEFNKVDFQKYPLLNLYNNGSFFNTNEIPDEARIELLKMINQNPYIKMVVFETRPEFIEMSKMEEIKRFIPNKHVELAMGLEVVDDFLRYICINKGFTLKQFEEAAKMITSKVHLRTYVLLKPPFLAEKESIEQAIKTIEYAFAVGSTTVSLETCTIQDHTLTHYLSEKGYYKTAWLWSIIEVVKRTAHLGKLVVGLFQFYPSPKKVPYNCDKCSNEVMSAIREYNRTLNTGVFNNLTCSCKKEWEKELAREELPFIKRLEGIEFESLCS